MYLVTYALLNVRIKLGWGEYKGSNKNKRRAEKVSVVENSRFPGNTCCMIKLTKLLLPFFYYQ